MHTLQTLAESLGKASRSGQGWVCQCPAHDDQDPSLSLGWGDHKQLMLYCHAGCSFEQIRSALQGRGLWPLMASDQPIEPHSSYAVKAQDYLCRLWHQALPIEEGTPAYLYLRHRLGSSLETIPPTLRYLPHTKHAPTGHVYPCLLAAITHYPGRRITALHRTFLSPDGASKAPVQTPKMMLGKVRGGAVRLAPAGEELLITEGIENALTVQQLFKRPAWAALSCHNLSHVVLPPLPLAQKLYIAQDNDESGRHGALALAEKAWTEGRQVHILKPLSHHNDFNDVLHREGGL